MELNILKPDSHRIMPFFMAVRRDFPELAQALIEVSGTAVNGITIEIRPYVPQQTDSQRGYYHKWKGQFAAYCGLTPDEMHEELLCRTYGSEVVDTKLGRKIRPLNRSSSASRSEYSVLIDTLIRTAAQMGFDVPPPMIKERTDG